MVNSVTVSEKNLPLADTTVASLINPAAVLTPPAALPHNNSSVPYRAAANNYVNGQAVYQEHGDRQMNGNDASALENRLQNPAAEEEPAVRESVIEKREPKDFIFGKLIGEGSFSTVYLAKDIHTNKEYASK